MLAIQAGISINAYIKQALEEKVKEPVEVWYDLDATNIKESVRRNARAPFL